MHEKEEEPITQRVKTEVERAEEKRQNIQYRRSSDNRDWWVRNISLFLLTALVSVVTSLVISISNIKDSQNKHEIFINRIVNDVTSINSDLKGLQESKNNTTNLEKLINGQITLMQDRIAEQDRRLQMQGEALIEGNKSIHSALKTMIDTNEDLASVKRQIRELDVSDVNKSRRVK